MNAYLGSRIYMWRECYFTDIYRAALVIESCKKWQKIGTYLDVKIDKCVLMILNEWHGTYEEGEIAKYMEIIFLKCFFVFRMFEYCMKNVKLFSTDLLGLNCSLSNGIMQTVYGEKRY